MSPSALIHQTELEFVYQLKTKVLLTKVVGPDRGNKTMFKRFIYIGNIRSLSKFVRAFGLFPVEGSQMEKYAPELYVACQYMNSNDQSVSGRFGEIISGM